MYDVPGSAEGRFESRRDSPALRSSVAVAESLWDIGCIVVELLSTEMPRRRCFGFVCTDCSSVWQQLHSEQRRLFFCLQNDLVKMPALVVRWICERKFGKNCQQFDGIKFCVTTSDVFRVSGLYVTGLRLLPSTVLDTCHSRGCSFEGKSTESDRLGRVSPEASPDMRRHAYMCSSARDVVGQTTEDQACC
jgi:hypothetical protein